MNKLHEILAASAVFALTAACHTSAPAAQTPNPAAAWAETPAATLYARDGTAVQGAGSVAAEPPRHDAGVPRASRMSLLELYQKALEEKENYVREVQALQASVDVASETQAQLARERDDARTRAAAFEEAAQRAQIENADLAARLVTAQIRRLEAEKLLLETRLEALRRGNTPAADVRTSVNMPSEHAAPRERAEAAASRAHAEAVGMRERAEPVGPRERGHARGQPE